MRGNDAFLEFAASWWPVLDAATVLGWLRDTELLARVADGVLDDEAVRLLTKSWGDDLSVDDVPLVDELRYLLGDPPIVNDTDDDPLDLADSSLQELTTAADREFAGHRAWAPPTNRIEDDGFAHVLIDEAQDLTPMQWRMVGRRGRAATWTIVGDPAQSSWPVPEESERARTAAIGEKPVHAFHLSTNYRNSAEIYRFAAAYAERVGLDADLPNAVRSTGVEPREVVDADLESATHREMRELIDAVEGTVGIVVPVARRAEVSAWVAGWSEVAGMTQGEDARVVVLTGLDTKGLEFDGIVVVEPSEIEAESPAGRATLYVVFTRATQRMVTVSRG
jgi:superfamily I DNA/RNA helicase